MKDSPPPARVRRRAARASGDKLAILVLVGLVVCLGLAVLGGLTFYALRSPDLLAAVGLSTGITVPAPLPTLPATRAAAGLAVTTPIPAAATEAAATAASLAATDPAAATQVALAAAFNATRPATANSAPATQAVSSAVSPAASAAPGSSPEPAIPTLVEVNQPAGSAATATPAVAPSQCDLRLGLFVAQGNLASLEVDNLGSNTLRLSDLRLDWPAANGSLTQVRLNTSVIAAPADAAPDTRLPAEAPWSETGNRGLGAGVSKVLYFEFSGPAELSGYTADLAFGADCRAVRQDNIPDTPAPPTASATVFLTHTPFPTRLPTLTPTFGPSPTPSNTPQVTATPKPTATPGCSIFMNGIDFRGKVIFAEIFNQEALPLTITDLVFEWSSVEPELESVSLAGVTIWNGPDQKSPTFINTPPQNHYADSCANCHGDKEFNWSSPSGRTIPGGKTVILEMNFEGPGPNSGVYHSFSVKFDNGCDLAKSN